MRVEMVEDTAGEVTKADAIRELSAGGLTAREIAVDLGTTEGYVYAVTRKQKDRKKKEAVAEGTLETATEVIGSEYASLRDIISESSGTPKVNAILRSFSTKMPDDYLSLAKLLNRARIPVADTAFIVENWASIQGQTLTTDKVSEIIHQSRKSTVKSLEAAAKKHTPRTVHDLEREDAEFLDKQIEMLRRKQTLNLLKGDLGMESKTPQLMRRVRREPRHDAEGNPLMDKSGKQIYDVVEEDTPYTPYAPQQQNDMMPFITMMNSQSQQNQATFTQLLTALLDRKDAPAPDTDKDLLIKLMDTQREHQLDMMKQTQDKQLEELKQMIKERDMQDQFQGYMGELQEEIKSLQTSGISDDRFRLQMQTDLTKRLIDEVSGAKERVGGAMQTLAHEFAEDRRHLRHLEQVRAAQELGLDPKDVGKNWERARVPDVGEAEFEAIMSQG